MDSRRRTGSKENDDKKVEGVDTAKRYMEWNCDEGQRPPDTSQPKRRIRRGNVSILNSNLLISVCMRNWID